MQPVAVTASSGGDIRAVPLTRYRVELVIADEGEDDDGKANSPRRGRRRQHQLVVKRAEVTTEALCASVQATTRGSFSLGPRLDFVDELTKVGTVDTFAVLSAIPHSADGPLPFSPGRSAVCCRLHDAIAQRLPLSYYERASSLAFLTKYASAVSSALAPFLMERMVKEYFSNSSAEASMERAVIIRALLQCHGQRALSAMPLSVLLGGLGEARTEEDLTLVRDLLAHYAFPGDCAHTKSACSCCDFYSRLVDRQPFPQNPRPLLQIGAIIPISPDCLASERRFLSLLLGSSSEAVSDNCEHHYYERLFALVFESPKWLGPAISRKLVEPISRFTHLSSEQIDCVVGSEASWRLVKNAVKYGSVDSIPFVSPSYPVQFVRAGLRSGLFSSLVDLFKEHRLVPRLQTLLDRLLEAEPSVARLDELLDFAVTDVFFTVARDVDLRLIKNPVAMGLSFWTDVLLHRLRKLPVDTPHPYLQYLFAALPSGRRFDVFADFATGQGRVPFEALLSDALAATSLAYASAVCVHIGTLFRADIAAARARCHAIAQRYNLPMGQIASEDPLSREDVPLGACIMEAGFWTTTIVAWVDKLFFVGPSPTSMEETRAMMQRLHRHPHCLSLLRQALIDPDAILRPLFFL